MHHLLTARRLHIVHFVNPLQSGGHSQCRGFQIELPHGQRTRRFAEFSVDLEQLFLRLLAFFFELFKLFRANAVGVLEFFPQIFVFFDLSLRLAEVFLHLTQLFLFALQSRLRLFDFCFQKLDLVVRYTCFGFWCIQAVHCHRVSFFSIGDRFFDGEVPGF